MCLELKSTCGWVLESVEAVVEDGKIRWDSFEEIRFLKELGFYLIM